jgi:hypothetical protein
MARIVRVPLTPMFTAADVTEIARDVSAAIAEVDA